MSDSSVSNDFIEEIRDFAAKLSIRAGERALEMREGGALAQDFKQEVELV
ncbi:MAG: inositol monophosphatase, partial [Opitutales bacterium]|nr:inositol monophosphatase [Opitutales bacterium]